MKKLISLIAVVLLGVGTAKAQLNAYIEPKINVASLALGIVNPAVEIGFGTNSAVELSYVGSYNKFGFMGTDYPLILSIVMAEYRYYCLNKNHTGLFVGAHGGGDMYKTNKHILPAIGYEKQVRSYDWGVGGFLGATVGYKYMFKNNMGLEASFSGGWHHSWHEPHQEVSDDNFFIIDMNRTGEWLPYKAGIYFFYRFK